MNLIAYSRRAIEAPDFIPLTPSVAICVAYPQGRLHRVSSGGNLLAVLNLRFSDCDEAGAWCFAEGKDPNAALPLPMAREQAAHILDFVEKWRAEIVTVHAACYGGVSRSRGILAGLAAVYGWDDRGVYAGGHPNAWVKTLIVREARARGLL